METNWDYNGTDVNGLDLEYEQYELQSDLAFEWDMHKLRLCEEATMYSPQEIVEIIRKERLEGLAAIEREGIEAMQDTIRQWFHDRAWTAPRASIP